MAEKARIPPTTPGIAGEGLLTVEWDESGLITDVREPTEADLATRPSERGWLGVTIMPRGGGKAIEFRRRLDLRDESNAIDHSAFFGITDPGD